MLSDGLPAVEAACLEALREGVHSADVIINIPTRPRTRRVDHDQHAGAATAAARARCRLHPIRQPQEVPLMGRSDILATIGELKLYGTKAAFDEIIATAVKRQSARPNLFKVGTVFAAVKDAARR